MKFVDVLIGQDFELEFATSKPKIRGPKGKPGTIKTTVVHSMKSNDAKKQEP